MADQDEPRREAGSDLHVLVARLRMALEEGIDAHALRGWAESTLLPGLEDAADELAPQTEDEIGEAVAVAHQAHVADFPFVSEDVPDGDDDGEDEAEDLGRKVA